jgi:hypothetical protein
LRADNVGAAAGRADALGERVYKAAPQFTGLRRDKNFLLAESKPIV